MQVSRLTYVAILCLHLTGCDLGKTEERVQGGASSSDTDAQGDAPTSPLPAATDQIWAVEPGLDAAITAYRNDRFLRCSDGIHFRLGSFTEGVSQGTAESLDEAAVNEADRLNGIDQRTTVSWTETAYRTRSYEPTRQSWAAWSEWKPGMLRCRAMLARRRGSWEAQSSGYACTADGNREILLLRDGPPPIRCE